MQDPQSKDLPRTNRDRTEKTRTALMQAARSLFVDKGYGDTSTPEIVAAAGITRGALYHHFEDKRALFRAIVMDEALAVASAIERETPAGLKPIDALLKGSTAYLDAMRVPGRTRLLLIEGPSVLGPAEIKKLDEDNAARTLRSGLEAAIDARGLPLAALADLLSAAFDRAALAIDAGEDADDYKAAIVTLIRRVAGALPERSSRG
ncbi:TetR/AcrR family transcriptional regulator [Afipia birgiae]|jgi:AcrR family transcriptional regulator|uniref:TetR/AcrR family transcriptional regulator n=1 Tax=Afipia birgiae TaxID=151414 RepID=UPI0002D753A6|nr:TetR/AcrR family transcriptional regulator [Afipia birgiae]MBX9820807.1 TetR/AcrR family transcriptional regulator [Afipia birgiae]